MSALHCLTPHSIRGPSSELSRAQCGPHDIMSRNNTGPVTTQEIKHSGWKKNKKWGKHSSSKTRTLRCSSSWRCQLKTSAAPQYTEWLRESSSISPPHVSPHLLWINMQAMFPPRRVSSGAEILFADVRRCPKGKKMVVVTLNECSHVLEQCSINAKPQKVFISLRCQSTTLSVWRREMSNHWQMSTGLFPDIQGVFANWR